MSNQGKFVMRLLFVLRSVAIHGGVERVVVDKMNYLAEQGHEITLVTYEQGTHPCVYQLNSHVRPVDMDCCFYTLYRYSLPVRLFKMWLMSLCFKKRFYRFVVEQHPDIIITVSNSAEFLHQIMMTPNVKKVLEAHGAYPAIMTSSQILGKCKNFIFRRAVRLSDAVITLTNSDKPYWEHEVQKVMVVPNPINFYCDHIEGFERKPGRILCVARLEAQKRVDRLIDAFALIACRYPAWYIDVYGDGVEHDALFNQISRLNLESRIRLNPPTNQIKQEYQSSQFSVLCSDYEGFGLVIAESMACGTPVVSTDCAFGPSDIIEDKVDGLLCNMDVVDLAEKMEWMITHDKERKEMGIRAHQSVARYRKEKIMQEWEKAYLSVI